MVTATRTINREGRTERAKRELSRFVEPFVVEVRVVEFASTFTKMTSENSPPPTLVTACT